MMCPWCCGVTGQARRIEQLRGKNSTSARGRSRPGHELLLDVELVWRMVLPSYFYALYTALWLHRGER